MLEPTPDGVDDSRYAVEGGNVSMLTFAQDVPESSFAVQKMVPSCSSANLNRSAVVFEVRCKKSQKRWSVEWFLDRFRQPLRLAGGCDAAGIGRPERRCDEESEADRVSQGPLTLTGASRFDAEL